MTSYIPYLWQRMQALHDRQPLSGHTPGHKNGLFLPEPLQKAWGSQFASYDYTELDGLDNLESRRILARECHRAGIPYIYGAVNGWVAQAAISLPGDHLIETLYPEGTVLKNKSVLSFTPALCASMQVCLCVKLLTGHPVETGTISYFDLLNQEFEQISMV